MPKESPKSLPLDKAYEFANENNLGEQAQKIQSFSADEISPKLARVVRKGMLIKLFEQNKLYDNFVNKYWPYGTTNDGRLRYSYCIKRADEYQNDDLESENDDSEEDVIQNSEFAMEAHLRDFLAKGNNLKQIEEGLTTYNGAGKTGIEFLIDDGKGRIDILAVDSAGKFVIIELKKGKTSRQVIGQLLYYMGWIDANIGSSANPCRGIIVANDIQDDLRLAVSQVHQVKVARYKINFSIEHV